MGWEFSLLYCIGWGSMKGYAQARFLGRRWAARGGNMGFGPLPTIDLNIKISLYPHMGDWRPEFLPLSRIRRGSASSCCCVRWSSSVGELAQVLAQSQPPRLAPRQDPDRCGSRRAAQGGKLGVPEPRPAAAHRALVPAHRALDRDRRRQSLVRCGCRPARRLPRRSGRCRRTAISRAMPEMARVALAARRRDRGRSRDRPRFGRSRRSGAWSTSAPAPVG